MPKTTVCLSIASTYRFWLSVLGRIVRPREDRMFCVSTSAGVSGPSPSPFSLALSMAIERSTASSVIGCPVRSTSIISANRRWITAMSAGAPTALISLPRTCMSAAGKALSITRSRESPEPSTITMGCWAGTVICAVACPCAGV